MKYTITQINTMKEVLIEDAIDSIRNGDYFYENIAREGFVGYDNRDDERIIEEFENSYGDDYFEVIDEKDHKNNLYGESI